MLLKKQLDGGGGGGWGGEVVSGQSQFLRIFGFF